jgi:N,N'-diacetyllegionaminate synthase
LKIANYDIGAGRCFIIAEAGVNHNGKIELARRMIDVAREAGADAVKFQTFSADRLAADSAPKAEYQVHTTGEAGSQHAMLKALELSDASYRELQVYCRSKGITFLSTPFDELSADFLQSLDVPAYKLSSGDLTNDPLIRHVCRKGRPVILSTGMATMHEVEAAVGVARSVGGEIALLQCVSNYPADPAGVNLRVMQTYASAFGAPVGYSDHTLGIAVPIAAAALGAQIIEKHFTLDRTMPGPDHRASLEPDELAAMIRSIRMVEQALGDGIKRPLPSELPVRDVGRKSLHWARDLEPGETVKPADLILLRPGTGLAPARLGDFPGRVVVRKVRRGDAIQPADIGEGSH